jgi:hypothetical protein
MRCSTTYTRCNLPQPFIKDENIDLFSEHIYECYSLTSRGIIWSVEATRWLLTTPDHLAMLFLKKFGQSLLDMI